MGNAQKLLSLDVRINRSQGFLDELIKIFRENFRLSLIAKTILLFSIGTPTLVFTECILFPQVAQAYTARVDLEIDTLNGENYTTMLRRAEAAARAAVQRSFDKDILISDVSVIVSVQNQGAIAPVLELEVSRIQWRNRPEPRLWSKYYKTASALLYFQNSNFQNNVSSSPVSVPENKQSGESNSNPAVNLDTVETENNQSLGIPVPLPPSL
ncbi:MAG: hypothetical protein ACFB02_18615 [Mastigocoleus sp.]